MRRFSIPGTHILTDVTSEKMMPDSFAIAFRYLATQVAKPVKCCAGLSGIVVHRADDDGATARQHGIGLHLRRLLPFKVLHLTGVTALEPLRIKHGFREWPERGDTHDIKPERHAFP